MDVFAAAFATDGTNRFVTLDSFGFLGNEDLDEAPLLFTDHVFLAVDVSDDGIIYACDDATGSLCEIMPETNELRMLVEGDGFSSIHENNGVLTLSDTNSNSVELHAKDGTLVSTFSEAKPSSAFGIRIALLWVSGVYLGAFLLVAGMRKLVRKVKQGETQSIGPMFMSVTVVAAIAIAIGNLSYASYQSSLETRAAEINTCADYLSRASLNLGEHMHNLGDRDTLRQTDDASFEAMVSLFSLIDTPSSLINAANLNGIGMYYNVYGKDDRGIYYLYGSSSEYVLGTSSKLPITKELEATFAGDQSQKGLLTGSSLRDATQYRLVPIHAPESDEIIGVIEIGSRTHSFESSLAGNQARRVLALLVMVLVVYLAYSEARACARCLLSYRQLQKSKPHEAIAVLARCALRAHRCSSPYRARRRLRKQVP